MKRVLCLMSLALFGWAASARAISFDVWVQDQNGNPLANSLVYAVHYSGNGPDSMSQFGVTNAAGYYTFTNIPSQQFFNVYAATSNYFPSLADQQSNPGGPGFSVGSTAINGSTFTVVALVRGAVNNTAEIDISVQNATSSVVMGDVRFANGNYTQPLAYGMGKISNNQGVIKILNVPVTPLTGSSAGTFIYEALDPTGSGNNAGRVLNQVLATSATVIAYALDLTTGSLPIQTAISPVNQAGPTGSASVDGVVTDINYSSVTIPYIGINFNYLRFDSYGCQQGCTQNLWTNADQNGRFQLFGLTSGTTYYVQAQGGCTFNGASNQCYKGFTSPAIKGGNGQPITIDTTTALGQGDILFQGTPVINERVGLPPSGGGSGQLAIYVKDSQGNLIPQAGIGLWPDGSWWKICGGNSCNRGFNGPTYSTCTVPNPGFTSFNGQATTGYVTINNLLPGNYQLNVWTGFNSGGSGSSFNAGTTTISNNNYNWLSQCGGGSWRLTIDTATSLTNDVKVYDSFGNQLDSYGNFSNVALSSITVVVQISTVGQNGIVTGALNFTNVGSATTVDLSKSPITITLQPQCNGSGPCPSGGGYAILNSPTQQVNGASYSVRVATGIAYWYNITSAYWGVSNNSGGQDQVDLTSTGTATIPLTFSPAGRWIGKVYTPNGLFVPSQGTWADVNAEGNGGWGWSQINNDGSFSVGGLLPGTYGAGASGNGTGWTYTTPLPMAQFSISANADTYQDVTLLNGVNTQIVVRSTATTMPPLSQKYNCSNSSSDRCPPENWKVAHFAAGTPIGNSQFFTMMDMTGGDSGDFKFFQSTTSNGGCNGPILQPGFCVRTLQDKTPIDMYLYQGGDFDQTGISTPPVRPYFVIIASSKNVQVNSTLATTSVFEPNVGGPQGSTITVENVDMTPLTPLASAPQETLRGNVTATNWIRQQDFNALGGNFQNFLQYLILASLYDSSGTVKAGGAVVPNPGCFNQPYTYKGTSMRVDNAFNAIVAGGDWTGFQAIISTPCIANGLGFDIRGLTPGATYSLVLTSPNYPPYKASLAMNVGNGSTTTISVNLDATVGSGATITGTVTDATSGAVIPVAAVTIKSPGYPARTVNTDTTGLYSLSGLPIGSYKITVRAAGYALRAQRVDVTAGTSYTANFAVPAATGHLIGRIHDFNAPGRPPMSGEVFAYNDTLNQTGAELALYDVKTSSIGVFDIPNVENTNVYKIFIKSTDPTKVKRILSISTTATNGTVTVGDATSDSYGANYLQNKPFDVQVFGYPQAGSAYEFVIRDPSQSFSNTNSKAWISPTATFSVALSTPVVIVQHAGDSQNNYIDFQLSVLSSTTTVQYLYMSVFNTRNTTGQADSTKNFQFYPGAPTSAPQPIDDKLIGDEYGKNAQGLANNAVALDASGNDPSSISLPAGSVIPTSNGAVPSLTLTAQTATSVTASTMANAVNGSTGAFASSIYTAQMSSINYTGNGIDLTISYNQGSSSLGNIGVYTYDSPSNKWSPVPGVQTIDPLKGTITIKRIKSLASVLGLKPGHPLQALSDGKSFRASAQAAAGLLIPDDVGTFAVLLPSLAGGNLSGTTFKIFNFPNPFNLSVKTVPINTTGPCGVPASGFTSVTTNGTVIKVEVPPGAGGSGTVRIYTLSGELVKEINTGTMAGGSCNYIQWDGRNRSGTSVANGVYYGILSLPGIKAKDATFKLAVIK